MTEIIDRENGFSPSSIISTRNSHDISWIDEKFRSRVVIFIMAMQMFSVITVIALFFWRTSELFSDLYLNYSIAIGLIYAGWYIMFFLCNIVNLKFC
jgi:hypothetical protein